MPSPSTIFFAGGGSGGHIFPNLAIAERLVKHSPEVDAHFLVSSRPLDAQVIASRDLRFTCLPVGPLTRKIRALPRWLVDWHLSVKMVTGLVDRLNAVAVVATGGFVSGPAVVAARRRGIAVGLVNLDAVPGTANRFMARRADRIFSVYDVPGWRSVRISVPLRRAAMTKGTAVEARRRLGLAGDLPTLLVSGGSQGARTINEFMAELARRGVLDPGWQVLHLAGPTDESYLRRVYEANGVRAVIVGFCEKMGLAWTAATIAVSRSGAGSVAEAWAAAVPTIFVPYPFHGDQHQRLNALPLVDLGAALLAVDRADACLTADEVGPLLCQMMTNEARRDSMRQFMLSRAPADGAEMVAQWLTATVVAQP